ncbi:hypothetical protein RN001_014004, partial [Aquatica leii]
MDRVVKFKSPTSPKKPDKNLIVLYQNRNTSVRTTPSFMLAEFQKNMAHQTNFYDCVLRLKGGMNAAKKPMQSCQSLLASYDQLLNSYKKTMVEMSHNIPEETRKSNQLSACGVPTCPFARTLSVKEDKVFQSKQLKSACGKPTCPFTKSRLGSDTSEEWTELQFMNDNTTCAPNPCGHHDCKILTATTQPLQPIHWDCINPLPKGPCRNPQCPLKPKELQYNPELAGPCGSTNCPYTPLPPCENSQCPFAPLRPQPNKENSLNQNQTKKCDDPNCFYNQDSQNKKTCGDPNCEFVSKKRDSKDSSGSASLSNKKKSDLKTSGSRGRSSSLKRRSLSEKERSNSVVKGGEGSGKKRRSSKEDKHLSASRKRTSPKRSSKASSGSSASGSLTTTDNSKTQIKHCGDPECKVPVEKPKTICKPPACYVPCPAFRACVKTVPCLTQNFCSSCPFQQSCSNPP